MTTFRVRMDGPSISMDIEIEEETGDENDGSKGIERIYSKFSFLFTRQFDFVFERILIIARRDEFSTRSNFRETEKPNSRLMARPRVRRRHF